MQNVQSSNQWYVISTLVKFGWQDQTTDTCFDLILFQVILNHLSSLFLAALEPGVQEESCGIAFGSTASTHLNLVMDKLDTLYKSQVG